MKVIYTDGSALKNGAKDAKGGFGVVVCEVWGDENPEQYTVIDAYAERAEGTTNNRMEMSAILWALEKYGGVEHRGNGFLIPVVYSDSQYCVNSFTQWIKNWKANGWVRPGGKKLENLDLIKRYDELLGQGQQIALQYIKGHAGKVWNEIADQLATGRITPEEVLNKYGKRKAVSSNLQE